MTNSRSQEQDSIDAKAIEILFRKHWSPTGWSNGQITPTEFDYAKQSGVMFDPIDVSHDAVIARAIGIRRTISPETVGNAFLASLSSRRMDWRSSLGSLAAITHLPTHAFRPWGNSNHCAVCGEPPSSVGVDINVLSFERFKWGGVRHDKPHYAILDLEWFASRPPPIPIAKDVEILRTAMDRISRLEASARPGDLEKSLRGLLPSNSWERRTIIDILGLAGVIIPRDRPTFWGEYPYRAEREEPSNKNDWHYPVLWWAGSDGINRDALRYWFPNLG